MRFVKRLLPPVMICLALCLFSGAASADVAINGTNFPDHSFQYYISTNFDKNGDNILSQQEINAVTRMQPNVIGTQSLKGIEFFTALEYLDTHQANPTELDLSHNTALTYLYCYDNSLTALDLRYNTALKELDCHNNRLTKLDIRGLAKLMYVDCYDNNLSGIMMDTLPKAYLAMDSIFCHKNSLTSLDLSGMPNLRYLYCYENSLQTLNIGNCTALEFLECNDNDLMTLDLSRNTALEDLLCDAKALGDINFRSIGNGKYAADLSRYVALCRDGKPEIYGMGEYIEDEEKVSYSGDGSYVVFTCLPSDYISISSGDFVMELYNVQEAHNHTITADAPVPATKTRDGQSMTLRCQRCGEVFTAGQTISHNKTLFLPKKLKTIPDEAFMGSAAQQITIPTGVTSIGSRAFANCKKLLVVVIPYTVETIADDAFEGCENVAFVCSGGGDYRKLSYYAEEFGFAFFRG